LERGRKAEGGTGRQRLASALFSRIEVLGIRALGEVLREVGRVVEAEGGRGRPDRLVPAEEHPLRLQHDSLVDHCLRRDASVEAIDAIERPGRVAEPPRVRFRGA
jgi:hypothetical protein